MNHSPTRVTVDVCDVFLQIKIKRATEILRMNIIISSGGLPSFLRALAFRLFILLLLSGMCRRVRTTDLSDAENRFPAVLVVMSFRRISETSAHQRTLCPPVIDAGKVPIYNIR